MAKRLELLCWNVHLNAFYKDNSYVVDELERLKKPDIVCLQEYVQGGDDSTIKWFKSNDYSVEYLPFAKFPGKEELSQGVLTAVGKHLKASSEPLVFREDIPRKYRDFHNIRGAISTVIKLEDSVFLNITNFHATYARPFTADMRKREFKNLLGHMDSISKNQEVLLCGDFNFMPFDKRKRILKSKFAHYTAFGLQKTWRHKLKFSPLRANLDYIFWKTNKISLEKRVLPFNTSDHRPILVEIIQS